MKKYFNLEAIMTLILLAVIGVMAFEGVFVEHLSQKALNFPGFVFLFACIFGIIELIRNFLSVGEQEKKPLFTDSRRFGEIVVLTVSYGILLYLVGFIAAGILLDIAYGLRTKYEKKHVVFIAAVCVIFVWYFLFTKLLGTSLPTGVITKLF